MGQVALIVIYNHQYNSNIDIIEQMYKKRFSNIYHLVPFYTGNKNNVISVYESSYYFQGYVAQGLNHYFNENYAHYIFIADDLILNPIVNQSNYTEHFKLKQSTCFLPGFITLHERMDWWARIGEAFRYTINTPGVEAKGQLPSYDTALSIFNAAGLEIKPLRYEQIWKRPDSIRGRIINRLRKIKHQLSNMKYNLSYPLVGSYSDVFVVSSDAIKKFCHYCGVFAATKLFVEVGLPTSLVLSTQEIVTENDLLLKGAALWTEDDYIILDQYQNKLKDLLDNFPENFLYIHPIKLSRWDTDL